MMLNQELTSAHDQPSNRPGIDSPRLPLKLNATPGVLADEPMSEAGRKVLFHHFEIMLKHEPAARAGGDIEAIHDMRVATRRMRSAIRIFQGYYNKGSSIDVFNKSLKRIAAALGSVRDLDVFRAKSDDYADQLPDSEKSGLHSFRESLNAELDRARQTLDETLDGHAYARFVDAFYEFLTTPTAGARPPKDPTQPYQVRHVAPLLIYARYTALRAYETVLPAASLDTLHALRIEGKQLRYSLEFFAEVLGAESKTAIEAVKALQDHLGNLQDARVASAMLQDYVKRADGRQDVAPLLRYMAAREAEKSQLLLDLPAAWTAFTNRKVRRALALSVAAL